MRILVVATHIQLPGSHGGSTHVGELLENLKKHGPTLVLGRKGSTAPDVFPVGAMGGRPPRGLRHLVSLFSMGAAMKAVKDFKPDVIYERASSYALGVFLSKRLDIPMLTMLLDEHYSPLSLQHARRIVCTNDLLVPEKFRHKAVESSWGANPDRFHPGVDGADARQRLGFRDDETVIAYTGSFQTWHGLETLVAAAEKLKDRPIRYLLIGDGRGRPGIEALAEKHGVHDRFVFSGRVPYDDVPGLLAAADVCVAPFDPSQHDLSVKHGGFTLDPLKVFEYLAMKKPSVTVREPNIEKLFIDGEDIDLFRSRDAGELAEVIGRVVDDLPAARARAERGYDKVLAKHTWQAHAQHLVDLFGEMLADKPGA